MRTFYGSLDDVNPRDVVVFPDGRTIRVGDIGPPRALSKESGSTRRIAGVILNEGNHQADFSATIPVGSPPRKVLIMRGSEGIIFGPP